MRTLFIIFTLGFITLPTIIIAAPPEITGICGDGRIDTTKLLRPPWWSHTELLIIIGILIAIIAIVTVWNRSLNILARRRARMLIQEEIAHARTKLKVEERTELAVEIHDSISQALTGIALQLDAALSAKQSDPDRATRILSTASQMLASCRHELRCCLWDLRSRTFEEHDLLEAISQALSPHLDQAAVQISFNVSRNHLSESTTHAIIKIVRELTVNAVRHGHAKHIRIIGEKHDGTIRFSVTDDGCGFDKTTAPGPKDGHFGLQGIRERIKKHNGTFELCSNPAGTTVTITMLSDSEEENV